MGARSDNLLPTPFLMTSPHTPCHTSGLNTLTEQSPSATRSAASLTVAYLIFAAAWIFVSDRVLFAVVSETAILGRLGTYKGWLFVGVTAVGVFWLVRSRLQSQRGSEEKLRSFVEEAPVALAMLDRELRYVVTSRRWRTDANLGDRELAGVRHYDVFPNLPETWRAVHQRALNGETIHEDLASLTSASGKVVWLRRDVRPWRDASGNVGGILIFAEDVTAGEQAKDALAQSQARLRLALAAGRVSTWTWDVRKDRLECNEGIQGLTGRSRNAVEAGGVKDFLREVLAEDRALVEAAIVKALQEGTEIFTEYRMVRADGGIVWIEARGTIERDEAGAAVRMKGACVDVTETRQMQKALLESEGRFREVVETIREVFWVTDVKKNRITYVSPNYAEIWARPLQALYDSGRAWLNPIYDEDNERVLQAALTKQPEGTYDETYRVQRPDGSIRWVRDRAYPVRDATGAVVRIVGCASDITERKHLEEQFLRAQRLEAIGTLASGVAHDLNNILAPILMVGPLLKSKLPDKADSDVLQILEASAQRGANVVRQLLTFGRGITGERGPLQIRHLVREMMTIMHETFPREIGIVHQIPGNLWPVVGDATQLHQVLMNLCVNSRDAMPEGGRLSLDARNAEVSAQELDGHSGVKPGRFVVVTVGDTGHGISEDCKTKIFEPFFTTKEVGKGTGLGLSTVLGIVKSHGGFVTLESQVGSGTRFHVYLPAAEGADERASPAKPAEAALGRGELVLIVDDEPNVRHAMQQVLEHNGYQVLTAANGREGLGFYLLQRKKVRVVVTDLMMPEMNGVALVRALRDLDADLPILAATGLADEDQREALAASGITDLLPKPYTSFELLDGIARALAATLDKATSARKPIG